MNDRPASGPRSPDPFPALRIVALIAAILGVLVLAAAAFVLSYPGIHQLARTAGMSLTLARVFPVIFDALLVVAIAAVLSLHGAGWWRRGYSWLITLLLLAAMAAGGVLHALHPHIPRRPAEVTAAVLPWALLLIALSLLLSMLRQLRQARLNPAAEPATGPDAPAPAGRRTGLDEILSPGARIVPADTQPGDTDRTATKPADLTTPTGTGWGSRNYPDTGAASNGTAEHRPAAAGSSDTGSSDTGPAGNGSADATPGGNGAADQPAEAAGRAEDEPDVTEAAPATSSGADQAAGPGEPPASPGTGTIHVPHQPMRAPVPAPSPHFDRLRSTPTPPEDDTDSDA